MILGPFFNFEYTNTRFDGKLGIVSQFFGEGVNYYKEVFDMVGHNGLDYAIPVGTKLLDPLKLIIMDVVDKSWGYGLHIIAEDAHGNRFIFAHLSEVFVKKDEIVTPGFVIALTGNSGNSTGPHLHFDITPKDSNDNNGFRGRVDPLLFIEPENSMRYVICDKTQYLLDDGLHIGISIADPVELQKIKGKGGLTGEPKTILKSSLDNFIIYPGVETKRLREILNI